MSRSEPSMPAGEEPLAVFTYLARAGLLLEALQKESLGTFDLSFVEYSVLRLLARAGAAHQLSPVPAGRTGRAHHRRDDQDPRSSRAPRPARTCPRSDRPSWPCSSG